MKMVEHYTHWFQTPMNSDVMNLRRELLASVLPVPSYDLKLRFFQLGSHLSLNFLTNDVLNHSMLFPWKKNLARFLECYHSVFHLMRKHTGQG